MSFLSSALDRVKPSATIAVTDKARALKVFMFVWAKQLTAARHRAFPAARTRRGNHGS